MNSKLTLTDFDYQLPKELIAQEPIKPRDQARLLVLDKKSGALEHFHFFDLPKILAANSVLVFNNSKVIPARLHASKLTGGQVEIFLLQQQQRQLWKCLLGGKIKSGDILKINNQVKAQALKQLADHRQWLIKFNVATKQLFSLGETPTPPYIKKSAKLKDYQTVFAKINGSVAAPTAGLHFTKRLLKQLINQGINIEFVTLHVGLGTFAPVTTENILEHHMHSEWASINQETAKRLNQAKKQGKQIIAVGTTAVRTLESFTDDYGEIKTQNDWINLFIYPSYQFKFVDSLITNFHLPKSTLLMLVSALAGTENIKRAYQQAIKLRYRFFSFGDGMLIK